MAALNAGMQWYRRISADTAAISILVAIIVCANLISFAYLSSLAASNPSSTPYPVLSGDSVHYAHWADNILVLHAYQDTPGVPLRAAPPGYPALLSAVKALTGSMTPVVLLQIALTALALVLIYRMARTLVPLPFATVTALAYGLDPMVILTDTSILTDALFSSLLVVIIYLAFFQSRLHGALRWGVIGLLLGTAIMVRPIGEFLIIVLPAAYLYREWMQGMRVDGSRVQAICAFVLGCAIIVAPWMARNDAIFGSVEISPLGGHNLMTFDVRGFLAWRALQTSSHPLPAFLVLRHENDPVFAQVDQRIAADLARITPPGDDTQSYEGQLAIRYILQDPIRYAYFDVVNTTPFFLSSSIASYGQIVEQLRNNQDFFAPASLSLFASLSAIRHPESLHSFMSAVWSVAPTVLEVFWWLLVTVLALAGLILRRRDFGILICALLVAYFAVLTGPMSNSRYRIPAEPYLLILAAAGLESLVVLSRRHTPQR